MSYSLVALKRAVKGPKTRELGQIPAVVYGSNIAPESLAVEYPQFAKLYKEAGEASLVDLLINGQDAGKVIVQEVQHDPISDRIIHVDLRRIDMNKEMTATVELRFVGEAPIIKASGGTLATSIDTVEVKCLPKNLVSHIDVDISGLVSYDVAVKVSDLKVPAGITITDPTSDSLVVKATPALTEEEIKAMEEASKAPVDLSKIEVAAAKKKESDEAAPAEGDAKKEAKKEGKKE